ncbi:MAG TPA: glycosyltransferase [Nitrososphaerales archaeon]|nr:glycosyltransferase [Nitrososphaerales archaeon]
MAKEFSQSQQQQNVIHRLSDYEPVVGQEVIEDLRTLASNIDGKTILHVNSTKAGGGVAEILFRLVPLMRELGLNARWETIRGDKPFFEATKAFHNSLQTGLSLATERMFEDYTRKTDENLRELKVEGDTVFIHDPQPAGMISQRKPNGQDKWIWRCHIDVSKPDPIVWSFLAKYVNSYDASVFSTPSFARTDLRIPQFMVPPSIDPLSDKNRELPRTLIDRVLAKYDLNDEKPLITQISRFDYAKDPIGVIEAFKLVSKHIDCELVLAGSLADDDPEGLEVHSKVVKAAEGRKDIHILLIPPFSDIEINALQRASTLILQKSVKEGFGLTVSEALWKSKPVIAGATGGIPLQVRNGLTGFLVHSVEGAAYKMRYLLRNPDIAKKMGENGREHVRLNFLITRHLGDYLLMILCLERKEKIPVLLTSQ